MCVCDVCVCVFLCVCVLFTRAEMSVVGGV